MDTSAPPTAPAPRLGGPGIGSRIRVWKRRAGRRVFLVATPGGHLDLLIALRDAFEDFERVWVVSPSNTAQSLTAEGERVRLLPRFHGYSLENLGLALHSLRPLLKDRPGLVVTAGSGSVVPYCLGACAMGARLVFLETMARVRDASAAGRTLSPFASRVLVQWPEMGTVYPGARVCRPALLDGLTGAANPAPEGVGTFVAVGTHVDPFDRLLRNVDCAVERGVLPEPVLAQTGVSTYEPRNFASTQWMAPAEIEEAIARTRYTICHAGSGMIARALEANRTPMVLPRLAALGEHIDDHQLQIAERLGAYGLIVGLGDEIGSEDLAKAREHRPLSEDWNAFPRMRDALAEELEALADEGFAAPNPARLASPVRDAA